MQSNTEEKKAPHVVAVYGSLKKGFGNHRRLETSKFVGMAMIPGTLYSLGAFPAITLEGNTDVHVELYEVDDPTLESLDRLEGHPSFYTRTEVTGFKGYDGRAYIYAMKPDSYYLREENIVKSGNWER